MSSSSAAALAPGATVYEQLTEFARSHNSEFVVVAFRADSNGNIPPQLSGSLRNGLIYPDDASRAHYDKILCLPDSNASYQSIMASKDGTNVSGSFHPDPNALTQPTAPRCSAACSPPPPVVPKNSALPLPVLSPSARPSPAPHTSQSTRGRNCYVSQAAEAERATALAHRQHLDAEQQRAQADRNEATIQRQRLADEADRAANQRDALMDEMRAAQADRPGRPP